MDINILFYVLVAIYFSMFVISILFSFVLSRILPKDLFEKYSRKDRLFSLFSLRYLANMHLNKNDLEGFVQRNKCFQKYLKILFMLFGLSVIIIIVWMLELLKIVNGI